ncbi:N-acetylmuramoyl-L-alanine amidase [Paenibacillus lactis]|uniref:peptidoglycan recognition protein family protein n=1 Tax=Paenibacillus lactis TaxID=228574 RepID=UPI00203DE85D|nr:peptidoglycan recognition family protein [Paenibacillus lactis]MCM3492833.1 N-acetylmuramoyl-L-alanine amidase [Paenibacillus lactis]
MKLVDLRGKLPTHKTKRYKTRWLSDIRSIAIHHSLTVTGSPEAFANYHVNTNGWPGIAYAFVVQRDGTVYKCWDPEVITYHVGNSNKHALGVCMVGDFRTQQPTPEQYEATLEIVRQLRKSIPSAQQIKGHSEYPGYAWKACPVIDMDKFRDDLDKKPERIEGMNAAEKAAFEALERKVSSLENSNKVLKKGIQEQGAALKNQRARIEELERLQKMDVPSWAEDAVNEAFNAGLISTKSPSSYEFYRMLTVLARGGLLIKRGDV